MSADERASLSFHETPLSDETTARSKERQLYVMRVWFEQDDLRSVWRASVQQNSEARRYFASADALLQFLQGALKCRDADEERHASE
ncbi:hypothetical protein DES52_107128 [Deinococcus yavapaiensis KR-236]|uniref:Uncharacterized protein n=2 Tax=Deinococcus TaxID=1298 RepID=A0A318SC30_9DEIO|nr:hypothetical protein DES52_107128 [Deinococcus yavapaiensis KR-236]